MYLPSDIWGVIWKKFFSSFVIKELKSSYSSVWSPVKNQSDQLLLLCKEDNCIQYGHTDFDTLVNLHRGNYSFELFSDCLNGHCENCSYFGFPCSNMVFHGLKKNCAYVEMWKKQ